MGKGFNYDFLKLEFKDIYDDIENLIAKESIEDINEYVDILIDDIIYFIYKKNKVLYDNKKSYLKRLDTLKEINILPNEIYKKIILFIEEIHNRLYLDEKCQYTDINSDSKKKELFEIIAWFVINCGEEDYSLILSGLKDDELNIFKKYLPQDKLALINDDGVNLEALQQKDEKEAATVLVEKGENYYFGRGVPKSSIKAFSYFLNAAKLKNEFAEAYLGLFYDRGIGVSKNYAIAFQWYYKAAIKGNAFSQYSLGMLYYEGKGVPKDYFKSFIWLQKSAENDYPAAFYQLGRVYYNGYGVDNDKEKAFKWYKKAADENFAAAQYALSLMYRNGEGCEVNMINAYYWVEKAAENDYEDAYYVIGKSYLEGIYVDTNYEKAFHYLTKGYEALDTQCIESLGDMYLRGLYVKKSATTAMELYNKAIEFGEDNLYYKLGKVYEEEGLYKQAVSVYEEGHNNGNMKCTQRLGIMYYNGEGVAKDIEKAIEYMELAVAKKEPHAMYVLAVAYIRINKFGEKTTGVAKALLQEAYELKSPYAAEYLACVMISELREGKEVNNSELLRYINFGVKNGLENSIYQLGYVYEKGIGVTQDFEKAYYYYSIAAEKHSVNAMRKLGDWYKRGIFFGRNIDLAIKWYTAAAEQNDIEAIERLIEIYELGIGDKKNDMNAIYYVFKLLDLDALKGKEKLAYYCFKGIGIEVDYSKGHELIKEIEDIDIGTACFMRATLAEEKFIEMTDEEIIKTYEEGIDLGNLDCYGGMAVFLYNNKFYEKEKYADLFKLAMDGRKLGVNKCTYIFLREKLKESQKSTLVRVEELVIIKQIKKIADKGVYQAINDLINWCETRRPEDKQNYYSLMEQALYYKVNQYK